tara:strand:- start:2391 stop:2876 length:486 start_codon:yes stop_codon:yes gene_type:complete
VWIGVGVGCLVLALVGCLGSWWWCKSKAEEVGGAVAGELSRFSLSLHLSSMKMSCASDPSGAGAANQFHPTVFPQYQAVACQVNDQTVAAFSNSCDTEPRPTPCSTVQRSDNAGDGAYAQAAGLDPTSCFSYVSGSAKIVGCNTPEQQFKIVHMENPAAVQ